ncbi:hypothetical protein cyc_02883 [Cyclospora cayetanensis]|uniref:Uncharacterized protein n=1 Tax=Cyclospora cayetanensis TaxID=88456 RepID=A0A1D3D1N2_9EIME|nr:hypothetical protein cyc_02883 [Cyclospora cayetanensis]
MEFLHSAILLLVALFVPLVRVAAALVEGHNKTTGSHSREKEWAGWPNKLPGQEPSQLGFEPSRIAALGSESRKGDLSEASTQPPNNPVPPPLVDSSPIQGNSGPRETPSESISIDQAGDGGICLNGLRLAFDCALRRVIAFGVRDHLIEKYKLPMVPLDICQGDTLIDVEQCIPGDFVVRTKQLIVGTMDLSAFPQLASDQGYTTGFYPELLQAVARELTVIVLQNPGLRHELVGDRQLDIDILDQPFHKRLHDIKAAVAQEWLYGATCGGETGVAAGGLRRLSEVHDAGAPVTYPNDMMLGQGGPVWHDGVLCGDASAGASTCELYGCLSPWKQIPKDIFIGITHVTFSTPMNLVAAVYRGEVHMTDVGTIASAYLPEKYNFLPLREILEPSCTIGAWKSFFLLREMSSGRRKRERKTSSRLSTSLDNNAANLSSAPGLPGSRSGGGDNNRGLPAEGVSRPLAGKDLPQERTHAAAYELGKLEQLESWETRMSQTRKLFFKLYGVQEEAESAAGGQSQQPTASQSAGGSNGHGSGRSSDAEAPYEEKTLVKLHHVDHFTFSYLFPEDFRICSVRRLTDLSSVLSVGEPIGAFGYGLAGRGGRRRIPSNSAWRCPPQQRRGQRILGFGMRRAEMAPIVDSITRRRLCGLHSTPWRAVRDGDRQSNIMEFPGPLVPLAAFFMKRRDGACKVFHSRAEATMMEKQAPMSSAAKSSFVFHRAALVVSLVMILLQLS